MKHAMFMHASRRSKTLCREVRLFAGGSWRWDSTEYISCTPYKRSNLFFCQAAESQDSDLKQVKN